MEQAQTIEIYNRYEAIDPQAWDALVEQSDTATWFQTREAYRFYASLPQEMTPFVYAVAEQSQRPPLSSSKEGNTEHSPRGQATSQDKVPAPCLTGVVVGYITQTSNKAKQFLTRRAIIIGGALLSPTISDEALGTLLTAVRTGLQHRAIYIETRNFHDYSRWRSIFAANGFTYCPHLNFHVDCRNAEEMFAHISESRRRQIKKALQSGVEIIEATTESDVRTYYTLLHHLYQHKVKTPLQSIDFFLQFYHQNVGKFLLVKYQGHIIGGIMCPILPNQTIYEWYVCGQDEQYKKQYPSVLATYAAMDYAAKHGIPTFDFMGAGKPDEAYGVRDFKARFGGKEVEHGRYLCVCHPLLYRLGTLGVKILKKR